MIWRAVLAVLVGVAVIAAGGHASGAPESVGAAQAALASATAEREAAEERVREAEARRAAASQEADRLGQLDAELTTEIAEARRALREYAIAAYIDGGQSEIFRSTLTIEQAQALAWQSSLLMGQSVSADDAAERFESLKQANDPEVLAAATALDRAEVALQDARNDLIQASAFERDAEAALARARAAAEQEAAARRAAAREAAAAAAASAEAPSAPAAAPRRPSAPAAPSPPAAPSTGGGGGPSGGAPAGMGNPTAAEIATLAKIRRCESGGNYSILSPSGRYRGAYQFDKPTWRSVGGTGDPAAASPAEQDYRALLLLRSRGTRPWPHCGR